MTNFITITLFYKYAEASRRAIPWPFTPVPTRSPVDCDVVGRWHQAEQSKSSARCQNGRCYLPPRRKRYNLDYCNPCMLVAEADGVFFIDNPASCGCPATRFKACLDCKSCYTKKRANDRTGAMCNKGVVSTSELDRFCWEQRRSGRF